MGLSARRQRHSTFPRESNGPTSAVPPRVPRTKGNGGQVGASAELEATSSAPGHGTFPQRVGLRDISHAPLPKLMPHLLEESVD